MCLVSLRVVHTGLVPVNSVPASFRRDPRSFESAHFSEPLSHAYTVAGKPQTSTRFLPETHTRMSPRRQPPDRPSSRHPASKLAVPVPYEKQPRNAQAAMRVQMERSGAPRTRTPGRTTFWLHNAHSHAGNVKCSWFLSLSLDSPPARFPGKSLHWLPIVCSHPGVDQVR